MDQTEKEELTDTFIRRREFRKELMVTYINENIESCYKEPSTPTPTSKEKVLSNNYGILTKQF